jgi:16S rRNA (cytidine1402-2'-O)-methyltransferase
MNMGTAGAVKDTGNEDFIFPEEGSADRADPGPAIPVPKAIGAAFDMHKPILSGKRGKGQGFYQVSLFQAGGTDRAGLGRSGYARSPGSFPPPLALVLWVTEMDSPQVFKKKRVSKPEQDKPRHCKNQNLKKRPHLLRPVAGFSPHGYTQEVATLYIIGTPIGNLGDISLRAVEILKSADLVACEDTRRTLKLLNHLGIHVRTLSCRAQNEQFAAEKVIRALNEGKTVAYASDAGTPGLSDPGAVLTRLAAEAGHAVIPVPGPSAFAVLVSVAGGLDKTVVFEGFLSPKPGRRRARLKELLALELGFVLYESPFRILKLLADLAEFDEERYICLGREMTKVHEEYLRGSVAEVYAKIRERNEQIGEFSVYVSGKKTNKRINY